MPTDPSGLIAALSAWRDRLTRSIQDDRWGPLLTTGRVVLTGLIIGLLAVQLTRVGWNSVIGGLPSHPLFYLLLVLVYGALPLTEVAIYKALWGPSPWSLLAACARKRVLNEEVMGYSGEVSLYLWAARSGLDPGHAFRTVRDVNIVSAAVSFGFAGLLVGFVVLSGGVAWQQWVPQRSWGLAAVAVLAVGAVLVGIRFRRYVFALSAKETGRVALLHLIRYILTNGLLIAMWHLARPEVGMSVWLIFATMLVVIERLPFLPSRDLIFLGLGVELSKSIELATGAIAGMLLVQSVGFKLLHLSVLLATTRTGERAGVPNDSK